MMNDPSAPAPEYFTKYKNFALSRSPSGVLTVRFHTDGGPATFTGPMHSDFPRLLEDIAFDRDNRVLVLTGTGEVFMTDIDGPSLGDLTKPMGFFPVLFDALHDGRLFQLGGPLVDVPLAHLP